MIKKKKCQMHTICVRISKKNNSNYIKGPKINYKTRRDPKMKLKGIRRIERNLWY